MKKRSLSIPVVVLIAVVALVLGSFGSATAASISKKQVKKIAAKIVDKKASALVVAKATEATNAANLGGKPAASYPTASDFATASTLQIECDPTGGTFISCATVPVTLTRTSKLLLTTQTPFGDDSTDGAAGICQVLLDGALLPGTTTHPGIGGTTGGVSDTDNTGMGVTNVTAPVPAGAHTVVVQCNETSADIDFNDVSMSVLAIPTA